MLNYILRRLWGILVMLLLLSMFTFALSRIVPGGPWMQGAQEIPLPPEAVAAFKAKYGMDKPLWEQYLVWLKNAVTLDFGRPFTAPDITVTGLILKQLPYSAIVGGLAAVLALVLGITLGMVAVTRPGSWLDNAIISWSVVTGVIPSFILAYILVFIVSAKLQWLPAGGWEGPRNLILPVIAYGIPSSAGIARWTRQCMLEAMSADYVRTAYAKGLRQAGVLSRHVLRNALIPMVTSFLPIFPGMMTGSIFIEKVFGLPGLGQYFVTSSTNRDYPLVLGITMFWAILISLTYLLTDILYGVIDPRVRIQEKST